MTDREPQSSGQKPGELPGQKPGDRRVRVERRHAPYFKYTGRGVLTARAAASTSPTSGGRLWSRAKAVLIGRPLATDEEGEERLSKKKALAIFSSDAISSSAYATEEILRALIVAGSAALFLSLEIAIAIAILLAIVSTSYRQIGYAYPQGGGAYAVARANLGRGFALVAAAALLVDYILTVSVSTSSAVEQLGSAFPDLRPHAVLIGVTVIALMTLANLRGLREAGNIFAVPTYLFVGSALLMIAIGVYRVVVLGEGVPPSEIVEGTVDLTEAAGIILLLRAFSAGSVALTGTEAIANGVQAFKPPEPKNAATTLTAMAILLAILFIGITFVADAFGLAPLDDPETGRVSQTIIAQVASTIYGGDSIGFYLLQLFTALILFLAANTAFNAFPRLAAILAQDGFMPRQFSFRGDRLAFSLGIVVLGVVAASLVIFFGGETHLLIPLYSVGVFVSFTISQSGMVRHWLRDRTPGWVYRISINAFGAVLTGVVAVVVTIFKAPESLLVVVIIPVLVGIMLFIERQYREQAKELEVRPEAVIGPPWRRERVVIPVPGINRAVVQAVNFGRSVSEDVLVVHVTDDVEAAEVLRSRFE
ncbi:MAG: APC family permease, partial [Candidatus Limnocylindrales bacterium]